MTTGPASVLAAPVIAVLGLGEAGSLFATDLMTCGATVRAFDPRVPAPGPAIGCAGDADAARGGRLILSLTSAHEAQETLRQAAPGIAAGAIYADLNTGSARLKQTLAEAAERAGAVFVDVALMAPVPGHGLRTPCWRAAPEPRTTPASSARSELTSQCLRGRQVRPRPESYSAAS